MRVPSASRTLLFGGVLLLSAVMVLVGAEESFGQVQVEDLLSSLKMDDGMDTAHLRKVRQAPPTTQPPEQDLNLAEDVDENYPVVFNIILFLAIALILALIAISVSIATMDPGRDSLIYRVTSAQRFKKDN